MPKRNETLKFSTSFLGTNRASAQTTIVDTSYPSTYNTKWSNNSNGTDTITSVNEGNDAWLIINTDNVPNGTTVRVMVNATGLGVGAAVAADFTNWMYSQDVTINNGFASVRVGIKADLLTEGPETYSCAVLDTNGTVLSIAYLTINDTSLDVPPTYSAGWYSTSTGTTPITTINEGSTAWLIINTTKVSNGTVFDCKITSATATNIDFADDILNREITINSNIGRLAYPIKADGFTEGDEVISVTLSVKGGSNNLLDGPVNLTIVDTTIDLAPVSTATDIGYSVVRGFNLADEFLKKIGRLPKLGDVITLTIPIAWAMIGSTTSRAGVTVDNRCNNITIIINNNGLISGIGGTGGTGQTYSTAGGDGILNTSNVKIQVTNSGSIYGGGGGAGASFTALWGGGGGAPYGKGAIRNIVTYAEADGKDATLVVPGESGYYQRPTSTSAAQFRAGPGGTMGSKGSDGAWSSNGTSTHTGALAGKVFNGSVNNTNIGSGLTKGN